MVVPENEVRKRLAKQGLEDDWLCGFRSVSSSTNERTAIFSVFPIAGVGNSINLLLGLKAKEAAFFTANGNSFVFDYTCRQKISGMNVNIWIMKQLPIISYNEYFEKCNWHDCTLSEWILDRALELTYTAWDLEAFARDCGYDGPPYRWDEERRFLLRCELDAAYFHLYGIAHDDVDYIMDTFRVWREKEVKHLGEYRTKRVILEIYDEMQLAIESGEAYRTRLDPPAADAAVAHGPRSSVEV
jgi:hypothetical protein